MILDELGEFADATALDTGGTGLALVGDVIDLGSIGRDIGNTAKPVFLVIQVDTTVTSGGAATVGFVLASDAQAAIAVDGSATEHLRTPAIAKATLVAALALGFGAGARQRGLPTNEGFSGFSNFDVKEPYAQELERALAEPGPRHIVMCHPGHPDAELAGIDPVVERRRMEYETLMRDASLPDRIWRPLRGLDGAPVDWSHAGGPA